MASHCQCHHQYPPHQQQNHHHLHHQTSCYSSSCCCSSCPSPHPSPPPHSHHSQTTPDPLVQALAAQLLQSSQSFQPHHQYQQHSPNQQHHQHQTQQTQTLFTSLIHRIDALESSLHHLSSSSSSSPSLKPPALSLRDLAARTIQTHFRAFLVRRSRTLRHLKYLAIVKSKLNSLKSSLSDKPHHVNYQALSQKAMDLLLKLDSVQGGDPMIRDGKKSISRELVRFLEFVDGAVVKKQHHYHKQQQQQQQQRGFSKPRKNVRFAEEVNESRSYIDTPKGQSSCEDEDDVIDVDDQQQLVENLCRKVEEMEGFARASENDQEEAPQVRNGSERNPRKNVRIMGNYENQNGSFNFSPPLPVQMEPRQDEFVKRETR